MAQRCLGREPRGSGDGAGQPCGPRAGKGLPHSGWGGCVGLSNLAFSDTDASQTAAGCHWQGRGARGCPQVMQRAGEEAALREAASVSCSSSGPASPALGLGSSHTSLAPFESSGPGEKDGGGASRSSCVFPPLPRGTGLGSCCPAAHRQFWSQTPGVMPQRTWTRRRRTQVPRARGCLTRGWGELVGPWLGGAPPPPPWEGKPHGTRVPGAQQPC